MTKQNLRKALWPDNPNRALSYLDNKNFGIVTLEKMADLLQCTTDEILRRPESVGVDVEDLPTDTKALYSIIRSQNKTVEVLQEQLRTKDQQISDLIKQLQSNENQ
ncbi:MAG: hypothetical protein K5683_02930 [Prevotella sp.]|nr:hypothetical protein [Prevotella sp.]